MPGRSEFQSPGGLAGPENHAGIERPLNFDYRGGLLETISS